MTKKLTIACLLGSAILTGVAGCANKQGSEVAAAPVAETTAQPQVQNDRVAELYEVHRDGRIYVFYDRDLYEGFLKTGHTAYMLARIASGPNGETLKFALTGEDKKKREGIPSVDLFDGKTAAADPFYGEVRAEGRIYVFSRFEDMSAFRKVGEAPYRYTDIGAGPNGETLVYVLNKDNKKQKPVALMQAFKARS